MTNSVPPSPAVRSALGHLTAEVLAGRDAVVAGAGAPAVLDEAATALAERGVRVLRAAASGPGGLGLSGLMAQVAGRPDLAAQDDAILARSYQVMTTPGEGYSRVALLVDGAEAMPLATLRCLQFVCRSQPDPVLVFAGVPALLEVPELAGLRARLLARPALAAAEAAASPLPAVASLAPRRQGVGWAGTLAGMAASALVGMWIGWHSAPIAPAAAIEAVPAMMPPAVPDLPPPPNVSEAAAQPAAPPVAEAAQAPVAEPAQTQVAEPLPAPTLPLLREPARTAAHPVPRRPSVPHGNAFRTAAPPRPSVPDAYARDAYARAAPGGWVPYPWYVPVGRAPSYPAGYEPYGVQPGF